jgi:hypothetical protein
VGEQLLDASALLHALEMRRDVANEDQRDAELPAYGSRV